MFKHLPYFLASSGPLKKYWTEMMEPSMDDLVHTEKLTYYFAEDLADSTFNKYATLLVNPEQDSLVQSGWVLKLPDDRRNKTLSSAPATSTSAKFKSNKHGSSTPATSVALECHEIPFSQIESALKQMLRSLKPKISLTFYQKCTYASNPTMHLEPGHVMLLK